MSADGSGVWDEHAATFDEEADHGLRDPVVRGAWAELLASVLPGAPAAVVDVGCGTGSLAVLLAEAGHRVTGLDSSAGMLAVARAKAAAARVSVPLVYGDASRPPLQRGTFDVVLVRHVLWALPDPQAAVGGWVRLLRPHGRLVLIEGRWDTGAGLSASECGELVRRQGRTVEVRPLPNAALWGRAVTDERFLLLSAN